jgi:hypothetical protein
LFDYFIEHLVDNPAHQLILLLIAQTGTRPISVGRSYDREVHLGFSIA